MVAPEATPYPNGLRCCGGVLPMSGASPASVQALVWTCATKPYNKPDAPLRW